MSKGRTPTELLLLLGGTAPDIRDAMSACAVRICCRAACAKRKSRFNVVPEYSAASTEASTATYHSVVLMHIHLIHTMCYCHQYRSSTVQPSAAAATVRRQPFQPPNTVLSTSSRITHAPCEILMCLRTGEGRARGCRRPVAHLDVCINECTCHPVDRLSHTQLHTSLPPPLLHAS